MSPRANLYRFSSDVEQDQAGLATYAYRTLGWRRAAVVAEDTDSRTAGARSPRSAAEFCALGGSVQRVWTPVYGAPGPLLKRVPASVDGVVVLSVYASGARPRSSAPTSRATRTRSGRCCSGSGSTRRSRSRTTRRCGPTCAASLRGCPASPTRRGREHGLPQGIRAVRSPACPPGVASNLHRAAVLHRRGGAAAGAREHARRARRGSRAGCARRSPRSGSKRRRGPVRLDGNRQAVVPATLVRLTGTKPGRAVVRAGAAGSPRSTRRSAGCSTARSSPTPALARVLARRAAALGALSSGRERLDRPGEPGLVARRARGRPGAGRGARAASHRPRARRAPSAPARALPAASGARARRRRGPCPRSRPRARPDRARRATARPRRRPCAESRATRSRAGGSRRARCRRRSIPRARGAVPRAVASQAPSSIAAQSCSAPENATSTGPSAGRPTRIATSQGASARIVPRCASPSNAGSDSTSSRSVSCCRARRTMSSPASPDVKETERAATPSRSSVVASLVEARERPRPGGPRPPRARSRAARARCAAASGAASPISAVEAPPRRAGRA